MSFLGRDPLEAEKQKQGMGANYVQSGPMVQSQPGLGSMLVNTAKNKGINMAMEGPLQAASTALLGTAGSAVAGQAALQGGTGMLGALGASGAMGAAAAPALAAMGPFAIAALPFLLNNGTSSVPNLDYGPDPLAQGYKDGTSCAGMNCNCASCKARKYNYGTAGVKPTTNMAYANGVDSVPSLLTPGEAVIPAPAAQNPANKPAINAMINEGRAANDIADGMPVEVDMTVMAGPLSGKAKREQIKLLQDMSFKKKAFEAEEQRKQQAFEQKMSQSEMKAMLAMRQLQE
jgi:hypothetical protein